MIYVNKDSIAYLNKYFHNSYFTSVYSIYIQEIFSPLKPEKITEKFNLNLISQIGIFHIFPSDIIFGI